jgi:PiT family inorganic phosphate transporter
MHELLALLIVVLVLSVIFDFINGFHDTANAIATVVATRVLTPIQAILMAASLNFLGAMAGTAVAKTIASGLIDPKLATQHVMVAALLAAITWNLITWFFGIPSSSSHAIMGSIVGAGIAQAGFGAPQWMGLVQKVLIPLVASPIIGFAFAWAIMIILLRLFIRHTPSNVQNRFGKLQLLSSAFMAFSHGSNDGQKTMGVMTLAIAGYLSTPGVPVPSWIAMLGIVNYVPGTEMHIPVGIKLIAAIAMGLGTAAGGWRVIKTMGHKLARLQPIHGFAAETAAATIIEVASRLGFPLSTTHVISTSIMGAGGSRRLSNVKWGVAGNIFTAWILTIPVCMILSAIFFTLTRLFFGD